MASFVEGEYCGNRRHVVKICKLSSRSRLGDEVLNGTTTRLKDSILKLKLDDDLNASFLRKLLHEYDRKFKIMSIPFFCKFGLATLGC